MWIKKKKKVLFDHLSSPYISSHGWSLAMTNMLSEQISDLFGFSSRDVTVQRQNSVREEKS